MNMHMGHADIQAADAQTILQTLIIGHETFDFAQLEQ